MGILKHLNLKAAGRVVEDAKKDVKRPRKDEIAAKRQQKQAKK